MRFNLKYTLEAQRQRIELENSPDKVAEFKAVRKALGLMEINIRHSSLCTHKFDSLSGPNDEEVFEAYAENKTSGAYRIFWYYGPEKRQITIISTLYNF